MSSFSTKLKAWWTATLAYLNVSTDLESQAQIEASIRDSVSFRGSQLLILIFSIFVASLGLNTDSTAVVIGAMLISPLMGPIVGMGLGIGIHDYELMRRGLKNVFIAMLGSVATSTIYFLISPQYEGASQLLARTSPSIYDVLIALFGGAAGIVSIACKNKGQVIPGVAIATSLMPPLCTAGYGLATLQPAFLFGALYLFLTNAVFILFATWIGIKLFGLKPLPLADTRRARRIQGMVYTVVILIVLTSCWLTYNMLSLSIFQDRAAQFVQQQVNFPGTQVLSSHAYSKGGKRHIEITLIGRPLPQDSVEFVLMRRAAEAGLGGAQLTIKQGFGAEALTSAKTAGSQSVSQLYEVMGHQLDQREHDIDSLQRALTRYANLDNGAARLAPELKVVFPQLQDMAISSTIVARIDSTVVDTVYLIMAKTEARMAPAETQKLADYIRVRLNLPSMPHVMLNPTDFPWPNRNK